MQKTVNLFVHLYIMRRLRRLTWRLLIIPTLGLLSVSCGTTRHTASPYIGKTNNTAITTRPQQSKHNNRKDVAKDKHVNSMTLSEPSVRLIKEAESWLGTPYAWGGNDSSGVDCSGLVLQVFLRSLDISLPRTSEQQMLYCQHLERCDLEPGDLVFFTVRGGDKVGHVGIYVGDGNMIHASSSKGVTVTPLETPYFVQNLHSYGRVERYYALVKGSLTKSGEHVPYDKSPGNKSLRGHKNFSTPMPSAVFGKTKSKTSVSQTNTTADEPDFFD